MEIEIEDDRKTKFSEHIGIHSVCSKMNAGITLIALVITIIVLLILAGISINIVLGENGVLTKSQEAVQNTKIAEIDEQAGFISTTALTEQYNGKSFKDSVNEAVKSYTNFSVEDIDEENGIAIIVEEETGRRYEINSIFELTYLGTVGDNIELETKQESITGILGYSNKSGIVGTDGVTVSTTFSRSFGKIDVIFLSGTSNIATSTANKPKTADGMIPIKWNGSNWVITNASDLEWYSYIKQDSTTESGGTSKWANIMLSDGTYKTSLGNYNTDGTTVVAESDLGSMFVWIPRYKYKITYYDTDANRIAACKGGSSTDYANYRTHPTFDADLNQGGWNTKSSGIWVAKFESSNSSDKIKVVPNVTSWRYITIGNMYTNSINMLTTNASTYGVTIGTIDSHMMKNSEWGAVAYLTESRYGRNGTEVTMNNNSNYITGIAGDTVNANSSTSITNTYNTTKGQLASTTGNIYGIYDMSGGAWEYTASYITNGNGNLSTYGSSFVYRTAEENPTTRSTKYTTTYGYDSSSDTNTNNYAKNIGKYGDAVYETSTAGSGKTSWNSDYSDFLYTSDPFFLRGGGHDSSFFAGVFSYSNFGGVSYVHHSYRLSLVL